MVASPTGNQIRLAAVIGIPIAVVITWFRLFLRTKTRKLWWDDFFAFLSMFLSLFFLTGIIIFTDPPERHHSQVVKVFANYIIDIGFYGAIWPARVSILLTLVRIVIGRFRTMLKYMVAAYLLTWAILAAQGFWTCESDNAWKKQEVAQCVLGKNIAIAQLITDCLADLCLIAAPVYLLSTLNTMRGLRIRLMIVFSSTILITVFSLVHAYAILHQLGLLEFMFALLEVIVSLVVANLSVIISWVFKLTDEESTHYVVNTFLREGRSGGRRSNRRHDLTTLGTLTTFTPAQVEITREVDQDTTFVEFDKSVAGAERIELPTVSSEELHIDDGKGFKRNLEHPYADHGV
ncbi:hypothetical protein D9758_012390 [Tetrapyrgos nigripes]|uniref:Rhodopsin domain-containing protein n=1 Tax=Tetrapyrgos nigripes TaxID=182062 RepID=A0A8H5FZB3_9AGAR|nr:hypothetical protein D9758_012390 [Tetrapyrgos nigripes]